MDVTAGNNLVLFFAGLSCQTSHAVQYWYASSIMGAGYMLCSSGLFALIGWSSGLCVGIGSVTFFGVACNLSSRQLMLTHLNNFNQNKSMHGKLLQGIALFQDVQVCGYTSCCGHRYVCRQTLNPKP
jgi:Kef-type K+ transport system membrane component KefB